MQNENQQLQQQVTDLKNQQMVVISCSNLKNMRNTSDEIKQMKECLRYVKCKLQYDGKTNVAKVQRMKYFLPRNGSTHYMDMMISFVRKLTVFQNMIARRLTQRLGRVGKLGENEQLYDQSNGTFSGEQDLKTVNQQIQQEKTGLEQMIQQAIARPSAAIMEEILPENYIAQLQQYGQFIQEQAKVSQSINQKYEELFGTANDPRNPGKAVKKGEIKYSTKCSIIVIKTY